MTFTPTPEQVAAIEFATNEQANLALIARAGAAKTSTLVLIAEALPKTDILCLAFNKKIALEMSERLPANCTSKTLHGLGYGAWSSFLGKRLELRDRKTYELLQNAVQALGKEDQEEIKELFAETLQFIGTAKSSGYLPDSYRGHWNPLITSSEDFYAALPIELTGLQQSLIDQVLVASFKQALQGMIDFDDMVYCPAICSVNWPVHDLYLVDEAQDLSPLNHHILKKMVKKRRIIAVGDPLQAIYGFRGADTKSIESLTRIFDMQRLQLTISFRCARTIIKTAQWRAPDMQWPEWAAEGEVRHHPTWSLDQIEAGDAIICRNNAPLFRLAIRMIEAGKRPQISGRDIAKPLKKVMQKLGKQGMLREAAMSSLGQWEAKELSRAREGAQGSIRDRASCIRTILRQTQTLGDAIAYLDFLLSQAGTVDLMTGHKSKGLEFDRVWFLEPKLCNLEYEQDKNLRYVIETRAKQSLNYITFEGMMEDER